MVANLSLSTFAFQVLKGNCRNKLGSRPGRGLQYLSVQQGLSKNMQKICIFQGCMSVLVIFLTRVLIVSSKNEKRG